jgi:hypothetical protein
LSTLVYFFSCWCAAKDSLSVFRCIPLHYSTPMVSFRLPTPPFTCIDIYLPISHSLVACWWFCKQLVECLLQHSAATPRGAYIPFVSFTGLPVFIVAYPLVTSYVSLIVALQRLRLSPSFRFSVLCHSSVTVPPAGAITRSPDGANDDRVPSRTAFAVLCP